MNARSVHALMCAFEDMLDEIDIRVGKGEPLPQVLDDLKRSALACQETLMEMRS